MSMPGPYLEFPVKDCPAPPPCLAGFVAMGIGGVLAASALAASLRLSWERLRIAEAESKSLAEGEGDMASDDDDEL